MMGLSALASFARQAMMTIRKHLHSTGLQLALQAGDQLLSELQKLTNKGQEKQLAEISSTNWMINSTF